MKIHTHKQNSIEWLLARVGRVTASEIDALISPTLEIRTGKGPKSYLCKKVAERILGYAEPEKGATFHQEQGHIVETQAIPWYSFNFDVEVQRVGFCESDDCQIGFSPDGLVGEDGGVEIKAPANPTQIEYLLANRVPPEYILQVQFSLFCSGRKWWDFVSFSRPLTHLVIRVTPDPEAQAAIKSALDSFLPQLDAATAKIREMMQPQGR